MLGLGEGRVGRLLVAEHQAERGVAHRVVVMDLGGAVLRRVLDVDHRLQRLVVDLHQFGGVARLGQRLGDDEGNAFADIARFVRNEERQERAVALGRAEILRHQVRGHGAELLGRDIGASQHGEHAGRGLGLRHIDALDAGVGVGREHVDAIGHGGQHHVVDVTSLPDQKALVFDPAHRLSDSELCHVDPLQGVV